MQRNHVKRQLRAILSDVLPELTNNVDIVVIPRAPAANATFLAIKTAVLTLLGKAGLIVTNDNDPGR